MMLQEIIVCDHCKGVGEIKENVYIGAFKTDEIKIYGCPVCNGSGRLIKQTTVNYLPFVPPKSKTYANN